MERMEWNGLSGFCSNNTDKHKKPEFCRFLKKTKKKNICITYIIVCGSPRS